MPLIKLKSTEDDTVLYQGQFVSVTACLESAVTQQINLENIDLQNANLMNANLDEAKMPGANLSGANLSGANLSESQLNGANITNAALYNTCLCYSDISYCSFEDSSFGATDITGANLAESRFSTLSTFSLDFTLVGNMEGCVFRDPGGTLCAMSRPPIVLSGLPNGPLVLMDHQVKIGARIHPYREWLSRVLQVPHGR